MRSAKIVVLWIVLAPLARAQEQAVVDAPPDERIEEQPESSLPAPPLSEGLAAETAIEESPDVPDPGAPEPMPAPEPHPVVRFNPGRGVQIVSDDGRFELIIRARAQFLAILRAPAGVDPGVDFEIRRARVYFQGCLFDPNIRFTLQLGVSASGSDMGFVDGRPRWSPLLDWYVELRHLRDLNVRIGQQIPTFSREFTVSDGAYQIIDRPLSDAEFNLDRDFAIELRSSDLFGLGLLRYYLGIASNQGRDSPFPANLGLLYYARAEVLPLGLFEDYIQGDLARNPTPKLSIGAAYAYLDRSHFDRGTIGTLPADGGTTNMHVFTADVVFMWAGVSLTYEVLVRDAARNPGNAIDPVTMMPIPVALARSGYGMYMLAGWLLPDLPIEICARWGMLRRMNAQSAIVDRDELGGAINWYIDGHPLKLSLWLTEIWDDALNIDRGETRLTMQLQATL